MEVIVVGRWKKAKTSKTGKRVHAIPPPLYGHELGRQRSLCGNIPTDEYGSDFASSRWQWTEDEVDCQVCVKKMQKLAQ